MDVLESARSRSWQQVPASENADAIVAAMAAGGVDHLFFTSGAEIVFYQEAIAKAQARGLPAPRLITMTHEHASLNAALGYAAVTGRPAATAAHVDAGTLNYGGAVHTAWRSGLPVLITAGGGPASYPGTMRGSRDGGGHIWMQSPPDQNGIVRQYVKWEHRLEYQDNAGLVVSRALQVALSEPRGPVFLTIPKEIALLPCEGASFPTAAQLGIVQGAAPREGALREVAERLLAADRPVIIVSGSGRDPQTVEILVALAETLGCAVVTSTPRAYLSFPFGHPLHQPAEIVREADVVLVIDAQVPWIPGANEPPDDAYVAVVDNDPLRSKIPIYDLTANARLIAEPRYALKRLLEMIAGETREPASSGERRTRLAAQSAARRDVLVREAQDRAHDTPVDPRWLVYQIACVLDDQAIVIDETLPGPANALTELLKLRRGGSYFSNPGSSGGWAPGAALGAKLGAPERDVVALTGDGFYMYGTAAAAMWAGNNFDAPFLTIVFQNRSYSTGTMRVRSTYPDSYAARAGFAGGYFDPPVDFAKEAEAAGGYGENVRDPGDVAAAIGRGLAATRQGRCAVVSVWLAKLLDTV